MKRSSAVFFKTDVTSWESQVALFAFSYTTFGPRVDFFFANAGVRSLFSFLLPSHPLKQTTLFSSAPRSPK